MRKIVRSVYKKIGFILCFFHELLWRVKIKFFPAKEKSILFIAHSDDDVLFFNRVMKEEKPYVVVLASEASIVRIREFKKAMKYYNLHYNYYSLKTRDEREDKLSSIIKNELSCGSFEKCYTHSTSGEYGHIMHKRVGRAVLNNAECPVFTPVSADEIDRKENELTEKETEEKINIFRTIYSSQSFVIDEYPQWISHEKIRRAKKDD